MSFKLGFDIAGAMKEVQSKDDKTLDRETADKWASRAMAVFILAAKEKNDKKRAKLLDWGDDLKHEALEHAALAEDQGKTVKKVELAMKRYRDKVHL